VSEDLKGKCVMLDVLIRRDLDVSVPCMYLGRIDMDVFADDVRVA
jgi:hypothetical protein